jgi:outer membrane protein assembly factor BamB
MEAQMKALLFLLILSFSTLQAGDWPQWRYGSGHGSASTENLPTDLKQDWTVTSSPRKQVWDNPLNHDLMTYDQIFEPVVSKDRMFLTFNDSDKLVALDVKTGKTLWTFYAEAPLRLAPAVWKDKVFFTCDDGRLYCINSKTGKAEWIFNGAPYTRKALGNTRIISAWPARGGVVVDEDKVYFSTSIWPFMGIYIYCINPRNGEQIWLNSGSGLNYQKQPHGAPSFAGVAPQGTLAVSGNHLIIPGGRSLPAIYDKRNGEFKYFNHTGKGQGGSFIAADKNNYFVHTRGDGVTAKSLKSLGKSIKIKLNEPVLDKELIYSWNAGKLSIYENYKSIQSVSLAQCNELIKSGSSLYAATTGGISIHDAKSLKKTGFIPCKEDIKRLLAASGRLFAVTLEGKVISFSKAGQKKNISSTKRPLPKTAKTLQSLSYLKERKGYVLCSHIDVKTILSLLNNTEFHITVLETDRKKIAMWRKRLDEAGVYGSRVVVNYGTLKAYTPPAYIFNLIISSEKNDVAETWKSVRPYGGVLHLTGSKDTNLKLPGMKKIKKENSLILIKEGALPGSADWSHMYGDSANSLKSDDKLVKLPLGILWFGGNTNIDVLPRHGHGPPQQVVNGRLIIEGIDLLSARDVYTGRVLWKRKFPDLGNKGVYYDDSYKDTPLNTSYNQKHIPGANGRGTNYVVQKDLVYVVTGDKCQVLDAATGENSRTIQMYDRHKKKAQWAFLAVDENYLIGGCEFADYSKITGAKEMNSWTKNIDLSACLEIVVFDRHNGNELWRSKSNYGFIHNGIVTGNGKIFLLDRLPKSYEKQLKRRGEDLPDQYKIDCFDMKTGKIMWTSSRNIIGSFLSYSKNRDILIQAGASGRDRSKDESKIGMSAYQGSSGKILWQELKRVFDGPCILHNDILITNASKSSSSGAYSLLTGKPHEIISPVTGTKQEWTFKRNYGCNTVIASEYMLTFRSGAAGFYDLQTHSGTGNFGGFKSSCTSNLVAANGILNAPDYTRTCSCSYQNQTSLGLIHMPELDYWVTARPGIVSKGDKIKSFGLNFGAPGDRIAADGTLWIDYPSIGGDRMGLPVKIKGGKAIRQFTRTSQKGTLPWVNSSQISEIEEIEIKTGAQEVDLSFYFYKEYEREDVFSIYINGKEFLADFSPKKDEEVFKKISLKTKDKVVITFKSKVGKPFISGLKVTLNP